VCRAAELLFRAGAGQPAQVSTELQSWLAEPTWEQAKDCGRSQRQGGNKTKDTGLDPQPSRSREETKVPEGEPCPYCAYLAANPEELRQHLLHLHPEVEPEPDWWDPYAVVPPLLL
jgi:hypothetical protein